MKKPALIESCCAFALFALVTIVLLWGQVTHLRSAVPPHQDPLFSIWRLAFVAHQLRHDPFHLFDANIFYPTRNALAYSDPTLFQGVIATPFLWAGASAITAYNVLVLLSFPLCACAVYWLIRELGLGFWCGIIGGVIYAFQPYRFVQYVHLEFLSSQWIPMSLVFILRCLKDGGVRNGLLAGLFLLLEVLSCLYYAVYWATALAIVLPLLIIQTEASARLRGMKHLAVGVLMAGCIAAVYSLPFLGVHREVTDRAAEEIASYSAHASDFLATPSGNFLYGWTARHVGASERQLFPGLLAIGLALVALWPPVPRQRLPYLALLIFSVWASFGFAGGLYRLLYDLILPYKGLRAPARFQVLSVMALAVLAAFGVDRLSKLRPRRGPLLVAICVAVTVTEYATTTVLAPLPQIPSLVYRALRTLPRGPLLELPVPLLYRLPGNDPLYQYYSTTHWYPLMNGYSGYYPLSYVQLLGLFGSFPEGDWLTIARTSGARYIVVHQDDVSPAVFTVLITQLLARDDVTTHGRFRALKGEDWLFELKTMASTRRPSSQP